jgi:catechol 2,3-dioxygenase-like lactoylglutathione lyase family enzyme
LTGPLGVPDGSWTLGIDLVTADLAAARRFYLDVIGLIEAERDCGHSGGLCHDLILEDQRLHLRAPEPTPPRADLGIYAGLGYRVMGLLVDDLVGLCGRITAAGGRVSEGRDVPGRLPVRFARDPDGNLLELIGLDEKGISGGESRIQIGLTVSNADASARFYREVMGFAEQARAPIGRGMTRYGFTAGTTTLKLWERTPAPPRQSGPPLDAIGIRSIRLPVMDAGRAAAVLASRGADSERTVDRAVFVVDPDDNWIELETRES